MNAGERKADRSGSGSEPNEDTPANANTPRPHHPGFGAAGIACLGIIVLGSWFGAVLSLAFMREYGIDPQGNGLDDFVGSFIFSLLVLGLAMLGVWFLRRSGLDRVSPWACLLAAASIVMLGLAGLVMELVEFADTKGAGRILVSHASGVFALATPIFLAWTGVRMLRSGSDSLDEPVTAGG